MFAYAAIELTSTDIVRLTLMILIGFSALTWGIIFFKTWIFWTVGRANSAYGEAFWSAPDLREAAKIEQNKSVMVK